MKDLPSPFVFAAEALTVHRFLLRLANMLTVAFLWIFIYIYFLEQHLHSGDALAHTLFLYALSEVVTLLFMPIALMYISESMLRGLVFGAALLALAYVYTGALALGVFPHGAAFIGILLGLYRALYRVPYTMERNALPMRHGPGASEFVLAFAPALVGFLISAGLPFYSLMFIASIVAVMSLVPLIVVPTVRERYSWSYRETFRRFIHESNAQLIYRSILQGLMGASLVVLWPLILFFMGVPSPALFGALISATLLISILFRKRRSIVLIEQHADGGAYVDEHTALKEMGSALGRIMVCIALGTLAALF